MTSDFFQVLSENIFVVVILGLILMLVGTIVGYAIGNISLRNEVLKKISEAEKPSLVQKHILNNIGLGVIVYDKNGFLYSNKVIEQLPDFIKRDIPADMQSFLNCYDMDNQLKSNYLLGIQNGINTIRANYYASNHIYEIKILRKNYEQMEGPLEIVIVEDITQIKDDEKRQKDLAANVSHELKTPLTVIKASEVFFENASPDNMPGYDEFTRWGDRIILNCNRMQDIVEDFLVLSMTSTTNKMGIFDIEECVKKAVANVSDYKGRDNVELTITKRNEHAPLLFGNGRLVMRLIINLLTNAIKYINYEGKTVPNQIKVSVLTIDDRIAVQVEDNGRGISQKDLDHLFERFYRVDNSGSRDVGGSGIGLAIAKEIADMHDGSIAVTSKLGSGSTFTFVMPVAETIFSNTRGDGKAGVISDKPFYRAAAMFLGSQICEAVKSIGYEDIMPVVEDYENTPGIEKAERDKKLSNLIKSMDEDRYQDLLDELLFVDTEMDDLDDLTEEETLKPEMAPKSPETAVVPDISDFPIAEADEDEPAIEIPEASAELSGQAEAEMEMMRQKEEARKLLTQPILPRSTQYKQNESLENDIPVTNGAQTKVIHPELPKKEYNTEAKKQTGKRESLFGNLQPKKEEKPEGVRSSLKKMLDENDTLNNGKL